MAKIGPKNNPQTIKSYQAEGALTENSFVKKGTTNDEVAPVATTDNQPAIGFIDYAAADNEMASILGNGSIVACIADGTVATGDEVVTGDTVDGVQNIAQLNPANNDTINIVGTAVSGATDGNRVYVELNFYSYVHGE